MNAIQSIGCEGELLQSVKVATKHQLPHYSNKMIDESNVNRSLIRHLLLTARELRLHVRHHCTKALNG